VPKPILQLINGEVKSFDRFDLFPLKNVHCKYLHFDAEVSQKLEIFSIRLFAFLSREDQNFMISPFAVYSLLAMIAEGARGDTFDETATQLELKNITRTRKFNEYLCKTIR